MGFVMPDFGLLFWMVISFSILLLTLKKFAWSPILKGLSDRENSIAEALLSAQRAREEMAKMQSENEKILIEANKQREEIVKEAREMKETILQEARNQASAEVAKLLAGAKQAIEQERLAAVTEMKSAIAAFSIDIAESVLKERLSNDVKQKELVDKYISQININ